MDFQSYFPLVIVAAHKLDQVDMAMIMFVKACSKSELWDEVATCCLVKLVTVVTRAVIAAHLYRKESF